NQTTSAVSTTPIDDALPISNTLTVKVTDNGSPALSATSSFTVVVNKVNSAPVLTVPGNQTINELSTLVVTNTATDTDVPSNTLTFAVQSGPPRAAPDPTTGMLSWTPTEAQGPSTNTITAKVPYNTLFRSSATSSFTVVVNKVNSAPVLTVPGNQTINELSTLVVTNTATDTDVPSNTL